MRADVFVRKLGGNGIISAVFKFGVCYRLIERQSRRRAAACVVCLILHRRSERNFELCHSKLGSLGGRVVAVALCRDFKSVPSRILCGVFRNVAERRDVLSVKRYLYNGLRLFRTVICKAFAERNDCARYRLFRDFKIGRTAIQAVLGFAYNRHLICTRGGRHFFAFGI